MSGAYSQLDGCVYALFKQEFAWRSGAMSLCDIMYASQPRVVLSAVYDGM